VNALVLSVLLLSLCALAHSAPITFAPGDYDNTPNTVISGPTPVNNQTTGQFRDVFWWSISNGNPLVGSDDYINQGNSLILVNNHATAGPGPYTALNFTGPSISGGQTYMAVYDTTPADGTATRNLFDATAGITVSADVLFVKHNASGGVMALYSEGQDALALVASNGDGNNPDVPRLGLVWRSQDNDTVLKSISLSSGSIIAEDWYRVTMNLTVSGTGYTVNGTIQTHLIGTDPTSALDSTLWSMSYNGSLTDPGGPNGLVLTNPGEVGVLAMGNESINLPDNVGVSVTNFEVPEPATLAMLALGGLAMLRRRK
jgi:hypothetical protein